MVLKVLTAAFFLAVGLLMAWAAYDQIATAVGCGTPGRPPCDPSGSYSVGVMVGMAVLFLGLSVRVIRGTRHGE